MAPFFETAIEHVWGGLWNRPGLELKPHLRGALNLGWTVDELREALLQIGGYAGFPAAHVALDVLSAISKEVGA